MPLLAPIFTEIYRYYLKLKIIAAAVIGIAQAGLELQFDFSNPRQFFEIDMTNPKGILERDMINPRAFSEVDMTNPRDALTIDMTNPKAVTELDMEELTT